LVATDGLCIHYAASARVYSWIQLVSVIHFASFWACCLRPSFGSRATFVLTLGLLFHLHLTGVLIVAGEVPFYFALWLRREVPTYPWARFALDLGLGVVLWLPVATVAAQVASRRGTLPLIKGVALEDLLTVFPLAAYILVPLIVTLIVGYPWTRESIGRNRGIVLLAYLYFVPVMVV